MLFVLATSGVKIIHATVGMNPASKYWLLLCMDKVR